MSDSKYLYDSRELAQVSGIDHNTVINDIEHIIDSLSDEDNQFMCFTSFAYPFSTLFYKMTQKGYDILQSYCGMHDIREPVKIIPVTDKNDNQTLDLTQFKQKVLEPESNITFEPLKKYQPRGGNNIMEFNGTIPAYEAFSQSSEASIAKSAPTEPRCKELLDLWYRKSKGNVYTAANTKCKELLEKDSLTQKIIQSLQTIRVLWGTDHPGDDNERQEQYKTGPGYYFEHWMEDYKAYTGYYKGVDPFWNRSIFLHLTCTTATEKLLKGMEEKSKQLLKDLENKHKEILLQINAADTYEQEIQILKVYGVLDTNGIISPAPADEITIPLPSEE